MIGKRSSICDGHEHAGHQGKMKGHVAFVSIAEISSGVLRPLVRFRKAVRGCDICRPYGRAASSGRHGFREDFHNWFPPARTDREQRPAGAPSTPMSHPKVNNPQHFRLHLRVVEIEVWLVGVEAVPEVCLGQRVPGPVGGFEVLKDDPRFSVLLRRVAPDVEVPMYGARFGPAGTLEPGMLVRGMIEHQFGDHPDAAAVGGT